MLFWYKNHISCDITLCHTAYPYVESFKFQVSFKSHHHNGHNLPLVLFKVFTASSHNVLYSTPQQIPTLPFLSLFPLVYLSCSSSNWRAYQRDVWQGIAMLERLFPIVLCDTIVLRERKTKERKQEQETMKQKKERTRDWNKWKIQLCVYPLNKSSIQIAFCWGPISQRHPVASSLIFHPTSISLTQTHISQSKREALICALGFAIQWMPTVFYGTV